MIRRLRAAYGEGPGHLLGHLLVFVGLWFAISELLDTPRWVKILVWLIGAALVHDLVLAPGIALGDRGLRRGLPVPRPPGPNLLNHVRVVLAVSGCLLLVYFPLILHSAPITYARATGRHQPDYLGRWLMITAGLALGSGIVYLVRRSRSPGVDDLDEVVGPAADEHPAGA